MVLHMGMQEAGANKKKLVKRLIAVFAGVMVLLTFFSNTINNFTAPRVTCERPQSGQLVEEVSGSGEIRAKKILELSIPSKMKVLSADVKAGETVKKGQTILTLDTSEIEGQIRDETDIYRLKELSVEKYREELSEQSLAEYDLTVDAAFRKLENAEKKLETARQLLEVGAESEAGVKSAETELEDAGNAYEAAKIRRDKSVAGSRQGLKNAETELEIQARRLEKLKDGLKYGKIVAPADGTILELNFPEGTEADGSKPLYRLADAAEGFQFYAAVGKEAASVLAVGDMAEVEIAALGSGTVETEIAEIKEDQEQRGLGKILVMDIAAEDLLGGEKGVFEIKKPTKDYPALVSNSAVGQDTSGYFVYVVNERSGPLGNEYYARRVKISTGGSDYAKTAVLSGIGVFDMIITNSDKPLSDGMRVMINQE